MVASTASGGAYSAAAADLGEAAAGGRGVLDRVEPGVLDHVAAGGEPGQVPGLGQDHRRAEDGHAWDGGDQRSQAQRVEHPGHPSLHFGQSLRDGAPVSYTHLTLPTIYSV